MTRPDDSEENFGMPPRRVEMSGAGVGEIGRRAVEQRALEIARADGRAHPGTRDYEEALAEIAGTTDEPDRGARVLHAQTEWGAPPASTGDQAPRREPDDEAEVPAVLTREGVEEADRDLRTKSAEGRDLEE